LKRGRHASKIDSVLLRIRATLEALLVLGVAAAANAPAQECPQLVGIWPYGRIVNVGAGVDGRVTILNGAALQVLDVDDPSAPVVVGEVAISNSDGESLEIRGERAYVSESLGLAIVDLGDPQAPTRVGDYRYVEDWRFGRFLDATGDLAYLQDGGLRILDVSDPADPRGVGLWEPPAGAGPGTAGARGTTVYVSTYPLDTGVDTLHVVDVTEPTTPVGLGSLGFADRILGVVATENLVYVLTAAALFIVDVTIGSEPSVVGSYTLPAPIPDGGWYKRLAVIGSAAYVRDHAAGRTRIIDVSNPQLPHQIGSFEGAANFGVSTGYCYLAPYANVDFTILDVSVPSLPVVVGTLPCMDFMSDISVYDGVAAIAATQDGLRLLDVTAPTSPVEVSVVPAPGDAWVFRVERSEDLIFATTDFSWWIVDVSDPLAPVTLSTPRFPGIELAVDGGYAYYCNNSNWSMTVVDASDPANPFEAGMVGGDAACSYIDADSQRAYTASSPGLTVVDVSDPWNPFILGSAQSPPLATGIAVAGPTAVRNTSDDGLRVIDVSNPEAPIEVASMQNPGLENDVDMAGQRAFVVGYYGLAVIDVARPGAPFEVGRAWGVHTSRVAVDHPFVYVLSSEFGVRIYDISGCDAIVFRDDFESGDTSRWPAAVP
jgi:hypothetical protein